MYVEFLHYFEFLYFTATTNTKDGKETLQFQYKIISIDVE